jgi:hypothetical protein
MKQLITALVLAATAITAQAYEPTSPHPDIEVRKLGGECRELMYALAKPSAAEQAKGQIIGSSVWAFGKGWRLNSKGQYVVITCSKYSNHALIAPKQIIDAEINREKQARIDNEKARATRVKNSGLL